MEKIPTIFVRDWNGSKKVLDKVAVDYNFTSAYATEKVDGTNVRLTIRNGECVRLEKRRNPSKAQKEKGIIQPWYVDADQNNKADKYIYEAVELTDISKIDDGEYSAEAYGEKIQGNPLNIKGHKLYFFTLTPIILEDVPNGFDNLKKYLSNKKSALGNGNIEGIVWHGTDGMCKIKAKDF